MNDEPKPSEIQPSNRQGDLAWLAQRANQAHARVADSLQQAVANALEVGSCSGSRREKTPSAGADPFERGALLLEQVIDELQRLGGAHPTEASYARHVLQPLDFIRLCIPARL